MQRGEVRHGGCEVSRAGGTNRVHTAGTGRRGVTGGVAGGNGQIMKPDDEDRSLGAERLLVTEGEVRSQAAAAQPHASRDSWRRGSEGWELKEAEGGG